MGFLGKRRPSAGSANEDAELGPDELEKPALPPPLSSKRPTANVAMTLTVIAWLVFSVTNSVFFKKMTSAMTNYSIFLNQITSIVYVPIFSVVVLASSVPEETSSFPKKHFAMMGILDALGGALCILGGTFTSGTAQLVFLQASIPISMTLTAVLLGRRYTLCQILGAAIILGAVVGTKLPHFLHPDPNVTKDIPVFNLLFFLAVIPVTLSQIYKEVAFNNVEMDVNYLQLWVAVYQSVLGFLFMPINSLPLLGSKPLPFDELPITFLGGAKCLFLGANSIATDCGGPAQIACDACVGAWTPVTIYLLANICLNVLSLVFLKSSGATLTFLVGTLRLPLSSVAFSLPFIMGKDAVSSSYLDVSALALVICGLGLYRLGGPKAEVSNDDLVGHDDPYFFGHQLLAMESIGASHSRLPCQSSVAGIRRNYYWRLRVASPLQCPSRRLTEPFLEVSQSGNLALGQMEGSIDWDRSVPSGAWTRREHASRMTRSASAESAVHPVTIHRDAPRSRWSRWKERQQRRVAELQSE